MSKSDVLVLSHGQQATFADLQLSTSRDGFIACGVQVGSDVFMTQKAADIAAEIRVLVNELRACTQLNGPSCRSRRQLT
jgi:hypothetical protein